MKKWILLFALMTGSFGFSQTAVVSEFFNTNDTKAQELHTLPWSSSTLIETDGSYDFQVQKMVYELRNISTAQSLSYGIPDCDAIYTVPIFLENGILFGGQGNGFDHALFYFDGQQSYSFDFSGNLNLDVRIFEVADQIFVVGEENGNLELFRFDPVNIQVKQLTTGHNVENVSFENTGVIYFQESEDLGQTMEHRFFSLTYDSVNQSYVSNLIRTVQSPNLIYWMNPTLFQGELYFTEGGNYTFQASSVPRYAKIVKVDNSNQITDVLFLDSLSGLNDNNLFVFENKLYFYLHYGDDLFTSSDGINFTSELQFSSATGFLVDYFISQDNNLYFNRVDNQEAFCRYNQGLVDVYTSDHIHTFNEFNGTIYIHGVSNTTGIQEIALLNTQWDIIESIEIGPGIHSPYINASVVFDDYFTFLFNYGPSMGVLQLISSATANTIALDTEELFVYPSALHSGDVLTISSPAESDFSVINAMGQTVLNGKLDQGKNQFATVNFEVGMYFIKTSGSFTKFIIE